MRPTSPDWTFPGLTIIAGLLASSMNHAAEVESRRRLLSERSGSMSKLAEVNARLIESEERFRNAFEYAAIGMALVDLNGRWTRVNQSLCRILGYTETELLVRDFQSITHPADLDADLQKCEQLVRGEIFEYHMVKRYRHRQGHLVWVLLSVSLVRDAEGNPLHYVSQIQDISERKRAEDALRASEEEYRATFEAAGVGKLQIDLVTRRIVRANKKLCDMLGYSPEELACRTLLDLVHPDEVDAA